METQETGLLELIQRKSTLDDFIKKLSKSSKFSKKFAEKRMLYRDLINRRNLINTQIEEMTKQDTFKII